MAEEHLEAVLTQRDQVLVEALLRQAEQLPQVQLGVGAEGASARLWANLPARAKLPTGAREAATCKTFNPESTHRKVSAKHVSQPLGQPTLDGTFSLCVSLSLLSLPSSLSLSLLSLSVFHSLFLPLTLSSLPFFFSHSLPSPLSDSVSLLSPSNSHFLPPPLSLPSLPSLSRFVGQTWECLLAVCLIYFFYLKAELIHV